MIAILDVAEGDPDLEDAGDDEPDGNERDVAWCEADLDWRARRPDVMRIGEWHEDAEEDHHSGGDGDEDDPSGWSIMGSAGSGPGCLIADPGAPDDGC